MTIKPLTDWDVFAIRDPETTNDCFAVKYDRLKELFTELKTKRFDIIDAKAIWWDDVEKLFTSLIIKELGNMYTPDIQSFRKPDMRDWDKPKTRMEIRR